MEKVINYLKKDLKLEKDDVIVLGNSAGPDSMCLLDILLKLRKTYNLSIICAHVNHNVREESKKEKEFLEKFCHDKDVIFETMTIEKYGDDNFENEARRIRYSFFTEVVNKYHAKYLMTAHHGDDLTETILMRMVRGSSLKGYSGFPIVTNYDTFKLVRPLLFITKVEALNYDNENNIPYAIDKSNLNKKYTRNRFRMDVLPLLKREDSNVHEKFLKFSETLIEYDNFINKEIKRIINKVYVDSKIILSEYNDLDILIKKKIINYILEDIYKDNLMIINDKHVKLIMDLINSNRVNASVCLPRGVNFVKSYDVVEIRDNIKELVNYEIEIDKYVSLPKGHKIELVTEEESNNNNVARIDSSEVSLPLYVRTRKYGDKMMLKKIDGYRKIKDIFIDLKVPKDERDSWPVVVDSKGKIIWLPGLKKSKFTKLKNERYDIILRYS